MPLYSYKCTKCHKTIEVSRTVDERDGKFACTKCGADMKRELGLAGIHFKGSGWYSTDEGKTT